MTAKESAPTKKKRPTPAEQDQVMANDIAEAETFLGVIAADTELAALLAKRGITEAKRTAAVGLVQTAKATYATRQSKLGAETTAFATVATHEGTVNTEFTDFRVFCRPRVKDAGMRQALGLNGRIPTDRQQRLTLIRTVYTEAQKPEHSALMTDLGYDEAELARLLGNLQALESALQAAQLAAGEALRATTERNEAIKALRSWMSTARLTAKRVLATRPDLLAKLTL